MPALRMLEALRRHRNADPVVMHVINVGDAVFVQLRGCETLGE